MRRFCWVGGLLVLMGCEGELRRHTSGPEVDKGQGGGGGGAEEPDEVAPLRYSCPSQAPTRPVLPLQRLTHAQLLETVHSLLGEAGAADATQISAALQPAFDALPEDRRRATPGTRHGGMLRLDQDVTDGHVSAVFDLAIALGRELSRTAARRQALLGSCATDADVANDLTCARNLVRRFGALVWRAPLSDNEVTQALSYLDGAGPVSAEGLADVIGGLFADARFFYRLEWGDPAGSNKLLSAHELAAKLSYALTDAAPDAELRAAADTRALLTEAEYAAQVERLSRTPRAGRTWERLVTDWLQLSEVPSLASSVAQPDFRTMAGPDLPPLGSTQELVDDVLGAFRQTLDRGEGLSGALRNRHSFARGTWLAQVYGVPRWDGASPPPPFPAERGGGLLTRAAFLVSGTAATRPVVKGVRLRTALLCDALGEVPAGALDAKPLMELPPLSSTRAKLKNLTETTAGCSGCHSIAINPLGFLTEGFDPLGRTRSFETVFTADGGTLGTVPVVVPAPARVLLGDGREVVSPEQLLERIDASGKAHSCLAVHVFRHLSLRLEDAEADGCSLSDLERAARAGAPLRDLMQRLVLRADFRERASP